MTVEFGHYTLSHIYYGFPNIGSICPFPILVYFTFDNFDYFDNFQNLHPVLTKYCDNLVGSLEFR